jgi:hypothetical protein
MLVVLAVTDASFTLNDGADGILLVTGAVRFRMASGKGEGTVTYRGRYDLLSDGGI